mmetsp:Transcript_83645/g.194475  ORF Transcript_83645/g.194475 Transcript_83645/m.194475 type:complete len:409 (+) Transcript_83645:29-1255(+)
MSAVKTRLTEAVAVEFVIVVLNIHNLDTVQQTYEAEMVIKGRTRGAAVARTEHGETVTPDNWEPRVRLLNLISTAKWTYRAKLCDDGELQVKYNIAGTFTERFELQAFPRDRQDLNLHISSAIPRFVLGDRAPSSANAQDEVFARLDRHVQLQDELAALPAPSAARCSELREQLRQEDSWLQEQLAGGVLKSVLSFRHAPGKQSVVHARNFAMSSIFDISPIVRVHSSWSVSSDSTTRSVRPLLRASVSVSRYPGYFFWNVELLMYLLTGCAGASFRIGHSVSDRLGVSLTLVLTAVAFKLVIAADMPKVSYQTAIDKFVLGCFVILALTVVENACCETELVLENTDVIHNGWWGMFLLHGIVYVIVCLWYRYRQRCEEREHKAAVELDSRGEANGSDANEPNRPLLS